MTESTNGKSWRWISVNSSWWNFSFINDMNKNWVWKINDSNLKILIRCLLFLPFPLFFSPFLYLGYLLMIDQLKTHANFLSGFSTFISFRQPIRGFFSLTWNERGRSTSVIPRMIQGIGLDYAENSTNGPLKTTS